VWLEHAEDYWGLDVSTDRPQAAVGHHTHIGNILIAATVISSSIGILFYLLPSR